MSEELSGYVDVWSQAIDDVLDLLQAVPETEWSAPTDLPGWSVHDVAAHLAHLEHLLAGGDHDDVAIGSPEHVRSPMDSFTEQGVVARRSRTKAAIIDELSVAVTTRRAAFSAASPSDPDASAPGLFGAIGWNMRTLLRNRPLDVWMHEQDIRRAVARPGNTESAAAVHTARYLAGSLGYVVAKRAQAPIGTTVVLEVAGAGTWAVQVGQDGRALSVEVPVEPTVRLSLSLADFGVLAGGRRPPEQVDLSGDRKLGEALLAHFALTP